MADNVEAIGNRASLGARRLSFGRPRAIDDFRIAHPTTGMRTSGTSDWTTSPEFW